MGRSFWTRLLQWRDSTTECVLLSEWYPYINIRVELASIRMRLCRVAHSWRRLWMESRVKRAAPGDGDTPVAIETQPRSEVALRFVLR